MNNDEPVRYRTGQECSERSRTRTMPIARRNQLAFTLNPDGVRPSRNQQEEET